MASEEIPNSLEAAQVYFMQVCIFTSLHRETELKSLREQAKRNKKEKEFTRKKTKADGHKILELEYKLTKQELKFKADNALMERDAYKDRLDATNTSFERRHESIMDLMTRDAENSGATSLTHPSSPEYTLGDTHKEDAEATYVGNEAIEDADDRAQA
ncbi:hypothetical protein Cgig2_021275 [Carnegiea gigantea]|uniref:Uncharacterized protein n=1 Tax=Carnegiea gigantea TaxID=171969 RepID=A0A9Q1JH34_9CARY|nr:hypothetical protein Cgig2_021275 [Carnegiea gigantea]